MKSGIYIIKNIINKKSYIGSAVNIEKRLKNHCWYLRKNKHCNKHLQNSYNSNGVLSFSFEKMFNCEKNDLIFYEQLVIDNFIIRYGRESLYNTALTAGSTLGVRHNEETKRKISLTSKGRWTGKHHTEETKKKMSKAQKGRIITPEARKKISMAMTGKRGYWLGKKRPPRSKEWKQKLSIVNTGKHHTEETKKKISKKNKGKKLSKERKIQIGLIHKGKILTKETRKKMSISHKGKKLSESHIKSMKDGWENRAKMTSKTNQPA